MGRLTVPRSVLALPPVELARVADWSVRLGAFIERRRHVPFAWGRQDCGLFAADAALEITGTDVADLLRGYSTAAGAVRALARFGCSDVADIPSRRGLPPRLHKLDARRGDVVAWRGQLGLSLGVVTGERFAVPGAAGLLFFPIDQAERAWRVGGA